MPAMAVTIWPPRKYTVHKMYSESNHPSLIIEAVPKARRWCDHTVTSPNVGLTTITKNKISSSDQHHQNAHHGCRHMATSPRRGLRPATSEVVSDARHSCGHMATSPRHNSSTVVRSVEFTPPQPLSLSELRRREMITFMIKSQKQFNKTQEQIMINQEKLNIDFQNELNRLQEMMNLRNSNQDPSIDLYDLEGSDKGDNKIDSLTKEPSNTHLMGDEVISTTPARENDEFIKSSVDDHFPILRESESGGKTRVMETPSFGFHHMPSLRLAAYSPKEVHIEVLSVLWGNRLPILDGSLPLSRKSNQDPSIDLYDLEGSDNGDNKIDSLTKEPSDTLLIGDEVISTIPARENDEFINSSADDLFPILWESKGRKLDVDLPLGEHLDTLSIGDREIDFDLIRDIKELERLLADDPIPVPRVFYEPLGHSDPISRSYDVTFSNPLFDFNVDYTLCYDNPLFDEEFEDISSLDPLSRL
uniref:NAC domain-containing protein n=1 Tax=Tanacetum cinerariifolium TaxID=118510 RepID=A0A6L2M2A4_TANCI|nr:NAC domain-containing protein [Tanacetum cinerariifolium]